MLDHIGRADPWQPWRPSRLYRKQIDAVVAAAQHLRGHGLEPIFDDTVTALAVELAG